MTNRKTIERLKAVRNYLCAGNPIWDVNEMRDVFELAISALESQESSQNVTNGDFISRKAVIDALNALPKWPDAVSAVCLDYADVMSVLQDTEKLPSAQPEPLTESEVIICKLYLECKAAGSESCNEYKLIMDLLDGKRAVQPERKKGKWMLYDKHDGFPEWKCSKCDGNGRGDYFYCPWCNADMRGDSDGSD